MDIRAISEILPHRYPFLLIDRIIEASYEIERRQVGDHPERSVLEGQARRVASHERRAGGCEARALEHDISVAPGPIFSARRQFARAIRLNYGHPWTAATERAMKTLGQLVTQQCATTRKR